MEVRRIVREAAEQIREKRNYQFFLDFLIALEARFGLSWSELVSTFFQKEPSLPALLTKTVLAIWILLEKDGKWPVVVRNNQLIRKKIELPSDPEAALDHLSFVGTQILVAFPFLEEQDDLDLVPEQFVGISQRLSVPTPVTEVEETLRNAYFHQRYFLHPVGAAVKLQHGGDVTGAFLKVKKGVVVGRLHTLTGDVLCLLDLNAGRGANFVQVLSGGSPDFLVRILANIYHALVVAEEKSSPRRKRAEEIPLSARYPLEDTEEYLSISYIPRTVYVGGKEQDASIPRTEGEFRRPRGARPIGPYSSWRGPISDHQRKLVREWEEATGLSILDRLPEGKTFVLPHFNPTLKLGEIAQFPLFIKKGIEAKLIGVGPRVA